MSLKDLRHQIDEEVTAIFESAFSIEVTETNSVPHSGDPAITLPNLDTQTQGAKLIDTCVLYIDIRRSTDLNLTHRPRTVAKLYSAFVRAMTHTARYYGGHVRGIIGDRVMVIFDKDGAFGKSVDCAIAMNTISQHVINTRFKANEVVCGIGIDAGKMLATKTGVRRDGQEQGNYRNLVWLGRPANIASKLTDLVNKPSEEVNVPMVSVAYEQPQGSGLGILSNYFPLSPGPFAIPPSLGLLAAASPPSPNWRWVYEKSIDFLSNLEIEYGPPKRLRHKDPNFASFIPTTQSVQTRQKTPPILMTGSVWTGYRRIEPQKTAVENKWFKKIAVNIPGYTGDVYGGNVIFPALKD